MSKIINRIAKNLHTFAKAEIILAARKYYPKEDQTLAVQKALYTQLWSDLSKEGKDHFRQKAILILTK